MTGRNLNDAEVVVYVAVDLTLSVSRKRHGTLIIERFDRDDGAQRCQRMFRTVASSCRGRRRIVSSRGWFRRTLGQHGRQNTSTMRASMISSWGHPSSGSSRPRRRSTIRSVAPTSAIIPSEKFLAEVVDEGWVVGRPPGQRDDETFGGAAGPPLPFDRRKRIVPHARAEVWSASSVGASVQSNPRGTLCQLVVRDLGDRSRSSVSDKATLRRLASAPHPAASSRTPSEDLVTTLPGTRSSTR